MPRAGMEPLPTTALQVSGKRKTKRTSRTPAKMARNQKMDRHPRYCARTPPIVGLQKQYELELIAAKS